MPFRGLTDSTSHAATCAYRGPNTPTNTQVTNHFWFVTSVSQFVELLAVGEGGLEPPRPEGHWHLKPARLPFRHSP